MHTGKKGNLMADASPAREFPRRYVAGDADFGSWEIAEPYFKELCERDIQTVQQLEQWLIDGSELEACFDEEGTKRYTAMTCQTDDQERQQRFLHFIENVQPHAEPWRDKLRRKFVALAEELPLPALRYEVLDAACGTRSSCTARRTSRYWSRTRSSRPSIKRPRGP